MEAFLVTAAICNGLGRLALVQAHIPAARSTLMEDVDSGWQEMRGMKGGKKGALCCLPVSTCVVSGVKPDVQPQFCKDCGCVQLCLSIS